MTADLLQACQDLAAWYPAVQALTTQPDTTTVTGRHQPCSRPPWNSAAANVWTDIHAGARELEQTFRRHITGSVLERGGSDGNTLAALDAIARLAEAVTPDLAQEGCRLADQWITAAQQLPAIDQSEPARKVQGACPDCGLAMLAAWVRSGHVACLSCRKRGVLVPGTVSYGYVAWDDGKIT